MKKSNSEKCDCCLHQKVCKHYAKAEFDYSMGVENAFAVRRNCRFFLPGDRIARCEECGKAFVQMNRTDQKYCSKECKDKAQERLKQIRYENKPEQLIRKKICDRLRGRDKSSNGKSEKTTLEKDFSNLAKQKVKQLNQSEYKKWLDEQDRLSKKDKNYIPGGSR